MPLIDELLERHEGRRLKPYKDTRGNTTIGVGRNLDGEGLRDIEATALLSNDIIEFSADLRHIIGDAWVTAGAVRQAALLDMRFTLGYAGFRGFSQLIACAQKSDWEGVATEAENSAWARDQASTRAAEDVLMLRTGNAPSWWQGG